MASQVQLKKIEEECDSLRRELDLMEKALTTKEGCVKIFEYTQKNAEEDPFVNSSYKTIWHQKERAPGCRW